MASEKQIQSEIFKGLGGRFDVRLFRQNVGTAWMGKSVTISKTQTVTVNPGDVVLRQARRVVFGLHKGSGDLIGWQEIEITPDMVGQKIARFTSVEVKGPKGRVGPLQENWANVVNQSGGRAGVARSVEDALQIVEGCHGSNR